MTELSVAPALAKGDGETWENYAHRLEHRIKEQRDHIKNLVELRAPGDVHARKRIAYLERMLGRKEVALAQQHEGLVALKELVRISYPATPVDCLISELREMVECSPGMTRDGFEERVAQFKGEVVDW